MVGNQNWKLLIGISFIVLALIYILDRYISQTEELIFESMQSSVVNDMLDVAKNVDEAIKRHMQHSHKDEEKLFEYFKSSSEVRSDFEHRLNLLVTPKMKYLYLIYKDKNEKFRYILDGSSEDKAIFNEKFDTEGSEYLEIYDTQEAIAITQSTLDTLAITYLYPILHDDEVEAILVFDFSSAFESELREIIAPLKTMFMLIYILIGIFLAVTIVQTIFYYQARKRSYIDALTACYNRQYLRYFLDENVLEDYTIMMIDFDYFKKINDNYGHEVGDRVLVYGTELIRENLTNEDKCFRYGGEEFLVLVHKSSNVINVAQEIKTHIENKHFVTDKIDINITVSIGVNPIPTHARNTSQAINIADSMLYKAKVQGRNRVVFYRDGMELDIDEKHSTAHNIHEVVEAIDQDRLICCFHKIIDKEQKVYKYEALVRYINSDGNMVYPNHFLSDITHTKVYTDMTKKVIDICIDTMKEKQVQVSLNLNINDLLNEVLVEYLVYKVSELTNTEHSLTIEILENEEIKNMAAIQSVVKKLHTHGVKFALDDFGSGYANYNYLVELDIDYVKIDGYLVQNVLQSEKARDIVKSIILLAHEMKIKTIVEFVSSQEIYDTMVSLSTDYMQGFYISKPEQNIT